jgi:hypothetical protein
VNKRIAGVAVLLVVGGFAVWRWYQTSPDLTLVPANPAQLVAINKQPAVPVQASSEPAAAPNPTKGKTLEIAKAFYASKDLRAFAEMAKKRPQEGGGTYAFDAINICLFIRKVADAKATDYTDAGLFAKKQAALNDLRYRCHGFTSRELSLEGINEFVGGIVESGDLLERVRNDFFQLVQESRFTATQRLKLMNGLAELQDPATIALYATEASRYYNEKGEQSYWVNGETYADNGRRELVEDAWRWASCQLGVDCKANSLILLTFCVHDSKCFDSIDSYYRDKYASKPALFQQLIILRDIIVTAFQTRDFSRLIRP